MRWLDGQCSSMDPAVWAQRRTALDRLRSNGFECDSHPEGTLADPRGTLHNNATEMPFIAPPPVYVDLLVR